MDHKILSALIPNALTRDSSAIGEMLSEYIPVGMLRFLTEHGVRIRPLREGELYRDASPALERLGIDVDTWPAPPAGLFVVEERTVYLRTLSVMTTIHEVGHSLDCALGSGVYHSGVNPAIRRAFASARSFVTPYAATGLDEYFAESVRAFVEANDSASPWPRATRERLNRVDATMSAIIGDIFERLDR